MNSHIKKITLLIFPTSPTIINEVKLSTISLLKKNNISISQGEMKALISASLGEGWIKLHPESVNIPENITSLQQLKPGLPPEVANKQINVGKHWEDNPNWIGTCDELAKLAKPTLVITGTDDNDCMPRGNALILAGKILGAWLVQIKDAGHAIINQYADEIGK